MTATVILTPFTCGSVTLPWSSFVGGHAGDLTVPVPAYLIEHPRGLAVFDAGLGPRFARPAGEALRGPVDLYEDALIDARLRAVGVDPVRVGYVINSHLHASHAGGNALMPAASVIVQAREYEFASAGGDGGYHAPEFDTGQPVVAVPGSHDVFGDGSVVLVPTPGHTPGHQSAVVRTDGGDVVLAGDACSLRRSLDEMTLPGHVHDPELYRRSLDWIRDQRRAGATIAFGHEHPPAGPLAGYSPGSTAAAG
jgi:N-acyl homoserine lactone hydrolase